MKVLKMALWLPSSAFGKMSSQLLAAQMLIMAFSVQMTVKMMAVVLTEHLQHSMSIVYYRSTDLLIYRSTVLLILQN